MEERSEGQPIHFREVQPMNRVAWVMFFVVALALLMWYTLIAQLFLGQTVGTSPGPDWLVVLFWLLFGLIFPALFLFMRLEVTVDPNAVRISFPPFVHRTIYLQEIAATEARSYDPLRDYGGWGIRGMLGKHKAYTTTGREGVELTLRSGERVMIGSQHPQILAQAIDELRY